ncbi:hypothetical protein [Streptococcus sp. LQJ-218]|uniref:hypothetical protein n=1 Tax=Streptococcus sp. LQJ-218 TaxID=2283190 RepID=UPI001F0BE499|nr:hypothetical protein [Streptococcus sp. LQJ-218]
MIVMKISNEILGTVYIVSYLCLLYCLWLWNGLAFLLLTFIFWGIPLLIIILPLLGIWIFTNLKSLVLIGYVASLLNSYCLYLVLRNFHLERITDTAGQKIPLSPWLSVAIIVFACLFLSVATLGFYKNFIFPFFKKNE